MAECLKSACHEGKGRKPIAPPSERLFPSRRNGLRDQGVDDEGVPGVLVAYTGLLTCCRRLFGCIKIRRTKLLGPGPVFNACKPIFPRSSHNPLLTSAAFLISSRPLAPTHVSRQKRDWLPQVQRDRCVGMRTPTGTCNAVRCAAVTVPRIPDRFLRQVGCACVCGWWWTTF